MLETCRQMLRQQYDAAFRMLQFCIDRCPETAWDEPVVNRRFCQVVFHTLFFADYYLGKETVPLFGQPFHLSHPDYFRDYEEAQDRAPQYLYERSPTVAYLQHCREKAAAVLAAETADDLSGPSGFARREFSRAEMHVYNIRHIHHHAAQLSLRLRIDHDLDVPWVGSGWGD